MSTQPQTLSTTQQVPASMTELRDLIFGLIDEMPEADSEDLSAEFRFRYKHLAEEKWNKRIDENTLWLENQIKRAQAKRASTTAAPARSLFTDPVPNFPAEFKALDFWAVYGKGKKFVANGDRDKVPCDPRTARPANTGEGRSDFATAVGVMADYHGLGFGPLSYEAGYSFIDFDECVDPITRVIQPHIAEIIKEVGGYWEFSPSGTGVHGFGRWQSADRSGHKVGHAEIYSCGRYFTVTGDQIPGTTSVVEGHDLTRLYARIESGEFKSEEEKAKGLSAKPSLTGLDPIPFGSHDSVLTAIAGRLRADGLEQDQIEDALLRRHLDRCVGAGSDGPAMIAKIAKSVSNYPAGDPTPTTLIDNKLPGEGPVVKSSEQIREEHKAEEVQSVIDSLPKISELSIARVDDMPEDCLIGRLGEAVLARMKNFPVAYSWLTLGIHAAQFVPTAPVETPSLGQGVLAGISPAHTWRQNLYFTPVGLVHSGKSVAGEYARGLLGMNEDDLPMFNVMPGSAEGLLRKIGNANGQTRLVNVDELGFLLERAALEGASFPYILDRSYYKTAYTLTTSGGKEILFNCRLSVIGGVTLAREGAYESFGDLYGSQTVGGMFDRTLLGLQPTGWEYEYLPFSGPSLGFDIMKLKPVTIGDDVWEAKNAWVKQYKLNPRVTESCIRVAGICASYDGRSILHPKDIETSVVALAKYQTRLRLILQPNTGKNDDGKLSGKFRSYLQRHASIGAWVSERKMLRDTNAYDYGTRAEKVLASLEYNGEIERGKTDSRKGPAVKAVRLVIV